jgi:hypothetical protein
LLFGLEINRSEMEPVPVWISDRPVAGRPARVLTL